MTAIQQQRLIGAILVALLVAVLAWVVLAGVDRQDDKPAAADDDSIVFEPAVEPINEPVVTADSADETVNQPNDDETTDQTGQEEARVVISEQAEEASTADDATTTTPSETETPQDSETDELTALAEQLEANPDDDSRPEPTQADPDVQQPAEASGPEVDEETTSSPKWVIQLGSFSKQDNAQSLERELREVGYDPVVEEAEVDGRSIYRVRLRSGSDRKRLEQIAADIADEMGFEPQIMTHTP